MKTKKIGSGLALASSILLSSSAMAGVPEWANSGDVIEKCQTMDVRAGMNDCETSQHPCSALAPEDNLPEEWIYVPEGVCERMSNAVIKATKVVP